MTVEFCGLELAHPVINGSGTFDAIAARRAFGEELLVRFPFSAFVSKTVTLESRQGNPPPRLWEVAGGLINSIGLPTKGIEYFLSHQVPDYKRFTPPLVASISAQTADVGPAIAAILHAGATCIGEAVTPADTTPDSLIGVRSVPAICGGFALRPPTPLGIP